MSFVFFDELGGLMEAPPSNWAPRSALVGANQRARDLVRQHGSPLLVLDCARLRVQYRRLAAALPGVDLHYAMKALSHPAVLQTLNDEGSYFDISTTGEIGLLVALGIGAHRVIHTHPIKRDRDIRAALEYGCATFVVDNPDEMSKFVAYRDRVSLILRVGFRNRDAAVDLAKKFGCAPADAFDLLRVARSLELSVDGLSFHVGSQCGTPDTHVEAINGCLALIERARVAGLPEIRVLDIGGGFPASYQAEAASIGTFCAPIRQALARVPGSIRVIAEPGRHLAAPSMEAIATVIGKARRGDVNWYYLDDGVYGSFSGKIYDGARYPLTVLTESSTTPYPSVLAGPTCDSVDIVAENLSLPELQIGDLVVAGSMGAYTAASASEFNSIARTTVLVVNGPEKAAVERLEAAGPGHSGTWERRAAR